MGVDGLEFGAGAGGGGGVVEVEVAELFAEDDGAATDVVAVGVDGRIVEGFGGEVVL